MPYRINGLGEKLGDASVSSSFDIYAIIVWWTLASYLQKYESVGVRSIRWAMKSGLAEYRKPQTIIIVYKLNISK